MVPGHWYYENYYSSSPLNNPEGPSSGSGLVDRAGSWHRNAQILRVADRIGDKPDDCGYGMGFRLARTR